MCRGALTAAALTLVVGSAGLSGAGCAKESTRADTLLTQHAPATDAGSRERSSPHGTPTWRMAVEQAVKEPTACLQTCSVKAAGLTATYITPMVTHETWRPGTPLRRTGPMDAQRVGERQAERHTVA